MFMHMAMTSIPEFDEFGIKGSIFGGEGECQAKVLDLPTLPASRR
jgi:hypothetical protein